MRKTKQQQRSGKLSPCEQLLNGAGSLAVLSKFGQPRPTSTTTGRPASYLGVGDARLDWALAQKLQAITWKSA